ncbi:MAG: acetate--CoA ligase family protein, partial [Pirellulales bacterium]|nr:acetate--CoA ligase family protein [Pirellulales bacterium]
MRGQNLDSIFYPNRIAVIGASDHPNHRGSTVMRNLLGAGCKRPIYPVNSDQESVHGIHAYSRVIELPKIPDLAIVCSDAHQTPAIVAECGAVGIPGMVILSKGFSEIGPEGKALEDQLRNEARRYPRMRVIGPNSYGIVIPRLQLNASFARHTPEPGQLAFISQSKGLCASMLDWAYSDRIGFSYFVSLGNAIDVSFHDLIDYFGNDPETLGLMLYIVSIRDVRAFMSAARAFSQNKPIVAFKSGRFAKSAEAAASHTGVMVGEDAVYDAAFQRAGIVRVSQIDDILDCAELLSRQRTPRGARLGIITNAWEPGVAAVDALLARDGTLASLSADTVRQLDQLFPSNLAHDNPAHMPRNASPEEYAQATRILLKDPHLDVVLIILTPRRLADPTVTADAVGKVAQKSSKPVLAAWMGGQAVQQGIQILNQAGVSAYNTPEHAIRAFMYLISYARNKEILYETPRDIPVSFTPDRNMLREFLRNHPQELLSECESKRLLESYGIPITHPQVAHSAEEAAKIARQIGLPVVLKILSPQITRKHEVQGVALDLATEQCVRVHYERIIANTKKYRPDADIEGVTVQKMVADPTGVELILGMKRDANFGAVIMVGMGGIATQVIYDQVLGLPPLNERLTRRMLESLKAWPLLLGYRGRPAVHIDRLIEIPMRLSYLVADHPEIKELDINPILATSDNAIALDACIRIDREQVGHPSRPYSHLTILP